LPAESCRGLLKTLSSGDDESALDLVRSIRDLDPALAAELERKLHEFEIEDLLGLLEEASKRD
jgi:hypothetical protein